jgi:hypothetical protein
VSDTVALSSTRVFKEWGRETSARWYAHPDGSVYHSRAVGHIQPSRYTLRDLIDKVEFEEIAWCR